MKIVWHITNKCNFSCPYCYYKDYLNKNEPANYITKIVTRKINKLKDSYIHLEIVGGEPMEIDVESVLKDLTNDNIFRIDIFTNFSFDIDRYINIVNTYPKVHLNISYHKELGYANFSTNILELQKKVNNNRFQVVLIEEVAPDNIISFLKKNKIYTFISGLNTYEKSYFKRNIKCNPSEYAVDGIKIINICTKEENTISKECTERCVISSCVFDGKLL